jgi:hypothetical protein
LGKKNAELGLAGMRIATFFINVSEMPGLGRGAVQTQDRATPRRGVSDLAVRFARRDGVFATSERPVERRPPRR